MKVLKPNLMVEAYDVIARMIKKEDCRMILKKLIARTKKSVLAELFEPAIAMMDACKDLIYDQQNPLYLQIHEDDENLLIIADAFFLQYVELESDLDLWNAFCQNPFALLEDVLEKEQLHGNPCEIVLHSDLRAETKLALLELYINGKTWVKQFETLLKEVMQRIAPIIKQYEGLMHHMEAFIKDKQRFTAAMKRMGLKANEATWIVVKLCASNSGVVHLSKKRPNEVIVYFGLSLCVVDFFTMNAFDHRELSDHLKMLADPTKRSILTILKKQETYQSDLANQLSLTTATISHHLDQLFQNGFVQSEVREGKVYYLYQEDMVTHTIDELKRHLGSI